MTRDCDAFDRWLDEGRPEADDAQAHAARCPRCASALAAARQLDRALSLPPAGAAPAGFTDSVMRRLRTAQVAPLPLTASSWLRTAADPVVLASAGLLLLFVWRREMAASIAGVLSPRLSSLLTAIENPPAISSAWLLPIVAALRAAATPSLELGLALALTPAVLWASWRLFQWTERAIGAPLTRDADVRSSTGV